MSAQGDSKVFDHNAILETFGDRLVTAKDSADALNIGLTKWWDGVRKGYFPQPIKIGPRCTRWSKNAIEELMKNGTSH